VGSSGGSSGGGGAVNAVKVRKFAFAHNTPNILTGATFFTPTVGDILLDGWLEVGTAWDGTTPLFDFGDFTLSHNGIFFGLSLAVDVKQADVTPALTPFGTLMQGNVDNYILSNELVGTNVQDATVSGSAISYNPNNATRSIPAKFTSATPFKMVVSQNGANNGADPGSTVGAGILYLVTATPA